MFPTADLLDDVLTFLSILHANDIAPMGIRFLPPRALYAINRLLCVADPIEYQRPSPHGGKRGLTERETERLRLIHFLCEAAHLVARTGRWLKPTPRAVRWLTGSNLERMRILCAALFTHDHHRDELWRVYRLPACRVMPPSRFLPPLFDLLRTIPRHQTIHATTLVKMIPFPTLNDASENSPTTLWMELLRDLVWLGLIEWCSPSAFRLTDLGATLLERDDAPLLPPSCPAQPLKLQTDLTLVAPSPSDWITLYRLTDYAELMTTRPQRVYRLDRARIQRALARGETLTALLHFLEQATCDALPRVVVETLQGWAQEITRVTIRRVTLLETRDRATLEQLTRVRAIRQGVGRTLSPRVVTLRERHLPRLLRHLERLGYPPRVELPLVYNDSTIQRANDATTFHLYLAARLGYLLPDLLPVPYRVPYAIVLELEKQLDEHDRALATQFIEEWLASLSPSTSERKERPRIKGQLSAVLPMIERAIDTRALVTITYYTASRDETTTRVVEPLRLEWHGRVPYLIAYCHWREDERVFRVERILQIASASD